MKKTLTLLQPVLPSLGMGRAALASAMTHSVRGRAEAGLAVVALADFLLLEEVFYTGVLSSSSLLLLMTLCLV